MAHRSFLSIAASSVRRDALPRDRGHRRSGVRLQVGPHEVRNAAGKEAKAIAPCVTHKLTFISSSPLLVVRRTRGGVGLRTRGRSSCAELLGPAAEPVALVSWLRRDGVYAVSPAPPEVEDRADHGHAEDVNECSWASRRFREEGDRTEETQPFGQTPRSWRSLL